MNIILLVILVAFSLLYGVQGGAQCVKGPGTNSSANSFCGCQLKDSANNTVINITLGFVRKKLKAYHEVLFEFTYSPCSSNSDCGDGKAAVCKHIRDDPFGHKSIGSLDSVTYTVNNPTFVNVSATYSGPEGTSVVYLVCDHDNKNDGSFTFVHHNREKKIYYFQLGHSAFCIPPNPSTTSKSMITTITSTVTAVTTLTVHTTLSTSTNTLTITTSVPSVTTGAVTTATSTVSPTSTSSPSNSNKDKEEKIVLVVVVSAIVGVMVLGVTVAVIVAYVRKKKRAQYEVIPTL